MDTRAGNVEVNRVVGAESAGRLRGDVRVAQIIPGIYGSDCLSERNCAVIRSQIICNRGDRDSREQLSRFKLLNLRPKALIATPVSAPGHDGTKRRFPRWIVTHA